MGCVISTFSSNHNGFGLSERGGERRRRAGNVSKLKPPSQFQVFKVKIIVTCLSKTIALVALNYLLTNMVKALMAFLYMLPLCAEAALPLFFTCWLYQTHKSIKGVWKSNPQLKLCVILAIGEPVGACNLNVHMTSQARNSPGSAAQAVFSEPM